MKVRCEGGSLDGREIDQPTPEEVIYQNGLVLLKIHIPYPKKEGERVSKQLVSWTEEYHLHQTEDGPVYRCAAPFKGRLTVGGEAVERDEEGTYHAYADREGKPHARRPE